MDPRAPIEPSAVQFSACELVQDLRRPLTSLLAATGLLANDRPANELADQVESVQYFGRRLNTALNDLEDLENLLRGIGDRVEDTFDLHQLLRNCVLQVEPTLQGRGLELRLDLAGSVPRWVQSDPARLRHLFTRALEIATQLCTISPVDVSASADDGWLRIRIAHGDPNCRTDGGGISLAMCRHLAAFLGGSMKIEAKPGGGLVMLIELPKQVAPSWEVALLEEDEALSPGAAASATVRGSVLLIENTPDHMFLIAKMVANIGARVTTAGNGQIALHLLEQVPFDLILLDMQMPELDAYATVHELRHRGITTPVLALTTDASPRDFERSLAAGCNSCIGKPIDPELLQQQLTLHLATSN